MTIAALTWAALAFGAVYPWGYWPLIVLCVTAGLLGLCRRRVSPAADRSLFFSCVAVIAIIVLQIIPLPAAVANMGGASRDALITGDQRPGMPESNLLLPDDGRQSRPLSLDPPATRRALAFVVGFAIFLLGTCHVLDRDQVRWIVGAIIWLSVALAVIGLVQQSGANGRVYGVWRPYYAGMPYGSFVNRNHFAGWMVMALPLTIACFCGRLERAFTPASTSWRERLLWFSSRQANHLILIALAILLMAVSLVMTLSRSGIACGVVALLLFARVQGVRYANRSRRALLALFILCVFTLALSGEGARVAFDRLGATDELGLNGRVRIWRDTLPIVARFPLLGTGLNSYASAIALVERENPGGSAFEAHNDYLQLAAEGGALLLIAVALLITLVIRRVRERLRQSVVGSTDYWIRTGASIGLIAMGVQELVEFSLHIPANAALFAVLGSIALSPSSSISKTT